MASYRVLKTSFVNNAIRQEGEIVDYGGEAGDNLESLDDPVEAPPRTAKARKSTPDEMA